MSLPNIYGRKPSAIVKIEGNEFIRSFDSRRQARHWRRARTDATRYKIVPNGAQEPDYRFVVKKEDPEKRKDGKADDQRHNRKGSADRKKEGAKKSRRSPSGNRTGNSQGSAGLSGSLAESPLTVGKVVQAIRGF